MESGRSFGESLTKRLCREEDSKQASYGVICYDSMSAIVVGEGGLAMA